MRILIVKDDDRIAKHDAEDLKFLAVYTEKKKPMLDKAVPLSG